MIIYRVGKQQDSTVIVSVLEVCSAPLDCYWEYGLLFSRLPLYWRAGNELGSVTT